MLLPISKFKIVRILYLIVYSLISIPIINNLRKKNINRINRQTPTKNRKKEIIALVVSLRGIPPSVIFFIKISVIIVVIEESKKMLLLTAIIASSCITFYIYFQMFVKIFSIETLPSKKTLSPGGNKTKEVS
jgi:NADH:ubiquinone oxidoreductase subunit 2 (subunit N)